MGMLVLLAGWAVLWATVRLVAGLAPALLQKRYPDAAPVSIELDWWRLTVRFEGSAVTAKVAAWCPARVWRRWFGVGAAVGLAASAASVALLASELWTLLADWAGAAGPAGAVRAAPRLALALPGVTLPLIHAVPLWLALALALAVHEAGHALAAAAEGVRVAAAGFSVALLLPAAHVELDGGDLGALGGGALLRVACAGAWHNAAAGLAAWGPLALGAPPRLFLGYLVSLSFALALLNMAPVHWLDGQAALEALLLLRRPGRPRRELPERGDDGEAHPASPASGGPGGKGAAALRWALHAGTALYAAVLLLHLARAR